MAQSPAQSNTAKSTRRNTVLKWLGLGVIALLTLLIYKQLYRSEFFLDDYLHLHLVDRIDNPLIPYFTNLFMGAFFRPGVFLFWKIDYALFGMNAAGYYVTNMAFLLALVSFLFFSLNEMTGSRKFAGFASALFAFSPVTSVGVLWLSNRYDLIGATFFMLALFLFLRFIRTQNKKFYYGAIASGVFSYFCKEMMITLPVVLVFCSAFMFNYRSALTWPRFRRILILATPFFTLGVVFILWRFGVIHSLGGYSGEIKVKLSTGYLTMLYNGFADYFWLMYFKKIFFVYILFFTALLIKADFLKNNPLMLLGISIAIITFIPLMMILQIQAVMTYMTPRFFFLPSIGMTILLASVYDPQSGRWRKFLAGTFLTITMLFFMFNTFANINKWVDDRKANVRSMNKIAEFVMAEHNDLEDKNIFYVLLADYDVALDAGIKMRHPKLRDRFYFLNPLGPTQVIANDALYERVGKSLSWPNTFDLNPCTYEDLNYGVVEVSPRDFVERMDQSNDVVVISKDKMGRLITADLEGVRSLLATKGVLAYE